MGNRNTATRDKHRASIARRKPPCWRQNEKRPCEVLMTLRQGL